MYASWSSISGRRSVQPSVRLPATTTSARWPLSCSWPTVQPKGTRGLSRISAAGVVDSVAAVDSVGVASVVAAATNAGRAKAKEEDTPGPDSKAEEGGGTAEQVSSSSAPQKDTGAAEPSGAGGEDGLEVEKQSNASSSQPHRHLRSDSAVSVGEM